MTNLHWSNPVSKTFMYLICFNTMKKRFNESSCKVENVFRTMNPFSGLKMSFGVWTLVNLLASLVTFIFFILYVLLFYYGL